MTIVFGQTPKTAESVEEVINVAISVVQRVDNILEEHKRDTLIS